MKEQYAEQYLLVRQEQIRKSEAEAAHVRKLVEVETEARMKIIAAQGSAEAYRLQAEAEAAEMKMKGYTYQQETARLVGLEAMKNGIGGGESGGLGDIAGLGVGLGAIGSVIRMTHEAMGPVFGSTSQIGQSMVGAVAPIPATDAWNCACGKTGITSKFCPDCGAKRPEDPSTWDCPNCGAKGLSGKFCPECGRRKGENR